MSDSFLTPLADLIQDLERLIGEDIPHQDKKMLKKALADLKRGYNLLVRLYGPV